MVLIFFFVLFGITGARLVLGIAFLSLPFYLIFDSFNLASGEKFVFSTLLGITIFPSLVYITGLVISFRISIIVIFVILLIISFSVRKFKLRRHQG